MLDHLVYVAEDLESGVRDLERLTGVRAAAGGRHRGFGTHNALLGLGAERYLEVLAPDPDQPQQHRLFGLERRPRQGLFTWAVRVGDLEARVAAARRAGLDPGPIVPLARRGADGGRLSWRLTLAPRPLGEGLVPFLIEWGETPHPASTCPQGCRFLALRGEHPKPEVILPQLAALGVELEIRRAAEAGLVCLLESPRGRLELR